MAHNKDFDPISVILMDLQAAGVSDVVGDAPADHFAKAAPKDTSKPEQAKPQTSAQHKNVTPIKSEKGKPTSPPKEPLQLKTDDVLWTWGEGEKIAVVLAADYTRKGKDPLSAEERSLCANMFKAMGLDIETAMFFALAKEGPNGQPLDAADYTSLKTDMAKALKSKAFEKVIFFGQKPSCAVLGDDVTLSAARSMAKDGDIKHDDKPVLVTYSPANLLRQPLLKRLAWQDMLAYMVGEGA